MLSKRKAAGSGLRPANSNQAGPRLKGHTSRAAKFIKKRVKI